MPSNLIPAEKISRGRGGPSPPPGHAGALLLLALALCAAGCLRETPERVVEKGRRLLSAGDVPAAILHFRKAIDMAPHDEEAHYQLAVANLAVGNGRVAAESLERAVQLKPDDWRAQARLAELMATSWDEKVLAGAQQKLTETAARLPGDSVVLTALAVVEWKLGARQAAQRRLEQALAAHSGRLDPVVVLAQMKLAAGSRNEAESLLKDAARGGEPDSLVALAEFHIVTGRLEEAEGELRRALARKPDYTPALLDLAALEASRNRKEEAARAYRKLASLADPSYRPLYGWFLLQTGRTAEAVAEFERLLRQDPASETLRTDLLSAYLAAGREADAGKMLQAAVAQRDPGFDALLQKAVFDLGNGRAEDAQASIMAALRLRPEAAEAHYVLAAVRLRRGEVLGSVEELDRAISRNPLFLPARVELARYRVVSRAPDVALELLAGASTEQRSAPSVVSTRAWALLSMDDRERFRAELEAVARGGRADAVTAMRVPEAVFRLERGEIAAARRIAEEILRENPSDERGWLLLARSGAVEGGPGAAIDSVRRYPGSDARERRLFWGELSMAAKRYPEAEKALEEAAGACGGSNSQLEISLARAELLAGRIPQAEARLNAAAAAAPRDIAARFLLGAAQQMRGDWAAAAESYRKVLDTDSQYVPALHNLAYLLTEHRGRANEALHMAELARELAPESAAVEDVFGWVLYRRGLSSLALIHLKAAAAGGYPRARAHLDWVRSHPDPAGAPVDSSDPVALGWVDLGVPDNDQARAEVFQRKSGCQANPAALDAVLWERNARRFTARIIPALMLCESRPALTTASIPVLQAATIEHIRTRWTDPDSMLQRLLRTSAAAGWDNTFISWDETRSGPLPKVVQPRLNASDLAFRSPRGSQDSNGWGVYDSLWPRTFH